MEGEESIGADFNSNIYHRIADLAGLYRMAAKKAEERQGCKRQGDYAAAPGAADRVSRPLNEGRTYPIICPGQFH